MMETLVRRRDFLSLSRSRLKQVAQAFVLLARKREDEDKSEDKDKGDVLSSDTGKTRIGYTVTRKIGKAVVRNRIKRRFRELARRMIDRDLYAHYDFLMIARPHAGRARFCDLESQMSQALRHIMNPTTRQRHAPRRRNTKETRR